MTTDRKVSNNMHTCTKRGKEPHVSETKPVREGKRVRAAEKKRKNHGLLLVEME